MSGGRGTARASGRAAGLRASVDPTVLAVDTLHGCAPEMRVWRELCPFHVRPTADIVVPGGSGRRSRSVEGVWQGLKLVDGRTELTQLDGPPTKRPPESARTGGYDYAASVFDLDGRELPLVTARYLIYVPTYLQVVAELADRRLLARIDAWLDASGDVVFYDWDANVDLEDPRSPFSHSSLLAHWFNGTIGTVLDDAERHAEARDLPAPRWPATARRPVAAARRSAPW